MRFNNSCAILGLVLTCVCSSYAAYDAVKGLQLEAYLGRWYTTHTNAFSDYFTGPGIADSECLTATYGLINNTCISVYNNYNTRDGVFSESEGYAYITDIREPGKLLVKFDGTETGETNYWIFKVGPIVNDQYDYAIISNEMGVTLYVFARDVQRFKALYEDEVFEYLTLTGFVGPRAPIEEYQGNDCQYPPFPLPARK